MSGMLAMPLIQRGLNVTLDLAFDRYFTHNSTPLCHSQSGRLYQSLQSSDFGQQFRQCRAGLANKAGILRLRLLTRDRVIISLYAEFADMGFNAPLLPFPKILGSGSTQCHGPRVAFSCRFSNCLNRSSIIPRSPPYSVRNTPHTN